MKHYFENIYDASGATRHALPIAWACFKEEWRKEYDTRAIIRGAEATKRQAEQAQRNAEFEGVTKRAAKAKREPIIIDGEAVKA